MKIINKYSTYNVFLTFKSFFFQFLVFNIVVSERVTSCFDGNL